MSIGNNSSISACIDNVNHKQTSYTIPVISGSNVASPHVFDSIKLPQRSSSSRLFDISVIEDLLHGYSNGCDDEHWSFDR